MRPGRLLSQFSTEATAGAAAIRYFTEGTVSHVDLVLPTGELLGARLSGGVAVRPPNYAKFTATYRLWAEVPDIDAAYAFAHAQVGKPYNWKAIVDMALHRERKFSQYQSSWFCDELNYEIYAAGGLALLNLSNPFWLTPQEEMQSPYWNKET